MTMSFRPFLLIAALGLSACVSANAPASRGMMPSQSPLASEGVRVAPAAKDQVTYLVPQYDVDAVTVMVPPHLRVSEANTFKPNADIVWRGEAIGDRHAQVKAIFEDAMANAANSLQTGRKVTVEVEVARFHALTEKTRYSIGGMHEMSFFLTVRDAQTQAIIDGPREVIADIRASGGSAAIEEERRGLTQRVVTVSRLSQAFRHELAKPVTADMMASRE